MSGTVNSALNTAFEEVRKAVASIQMESQRFNGSPRPQTQNDQRQPEKQQSSDTTALFPYKPVGKIAGVLYTVFGSIGIGALGTAITVLTIIGVVTSGVILITPVTIGLLIFLMASIVMETRGSAIRNRVKRFRRYLSLLSGRSICMITELASYCGSSEKYIVRDFRKMIAIGMFPQAHIDEKKTLILLNRESYELYLTQQARIKEREAEEQQKAAERKKTKTPKADASNDFDVHNAVDEGKMYLRQINEAKSDISDADVSAKVRRLEIIIVRIIEYVEAHPEKLPEIRRLMTYYLPTTVKLLNAYGEFDRQPIQGGNITTAKIEIKNALDTINQAFENLLDSLFENAAWDISADISVLQTILAQEGLTGKDFSAKTSEQQD
jgi:5-bromo-4-chloroindolyl phosphate hydrolysis protein